MGRGRESRRGANRLERIAARSNRKTTTMLLFASRNSWREPLTRPRSPQVGRGGSRGPLGEFQHLGEVGPGLRRRRRHARLQDCEMIDDGFYHKMKTEHPKPPGRSSERV